VSSKGQLVRPKTLPHSLKKIKPQEVVTLRDLRLPEFNINWHINQQKAFVFDNNKVKYDIVLSTNFIYSEGKMEWFDFSIQLCPHRGLDAKDFDDALSIQKLENGRYEIGVHIADVSYYVVSGSAMDAEALKRSNSVYLVDRVVPMLPEQLSNMACSLRPKEDKFSFSAVFEMDENGKVYKEWYGKTVIHSDRRFTYEEAQEIIEGKDGDFKTEILLLDKIAKIHLLSLPKER
jgi:hypothetical protein